MSYIRAPKLHQSTALLCPLLIKISGALKDDADTSVTEKCDGRAEPAALQSQNSSSHVFDGTAEGVGDRPVVNGLFAQAEVRQLHVSCRKTEALKTPTF